MWRKLLATDDSWATLVLRLALGLIIFPHGAQKLLGWFGGSGFAGTLNFFTGSLEIPYILAFLAIMVEFFGSLALIIGLLGRWAALALIIDMIGAIVVFNWANGFFWTDGGYEYPIFIIVVALLIVIRGSGPLSVDRWLVGRQAASAGDLSVDVPTSS